MYFFGVNGDGDFDNIVIDNVVKISVPIDQKSPSPLTPIDIVPPSGHEKFKKRLVFLMFLWFNINSFNLYILFKLYQIVYI